MGILAWSHRYLQTPGQELIQGTVFHKGWGSVLRPPA